MGHGLGSRIFLSDNNLLINTIDKNQNHVTDFKFETKVLLTFSDLNERTKILDDNAFIYKVHTTTWPSYLKRYLVSMYYNSKLVATAGKVLLKKSCGGLFS